MAPIGGKLLEPGEGPELCQLEVVVSVNFDATDIFFQSMGLLIAAHDSYYRIHLYLLWTKGKTN